MFNFWFFNLVSKSNKRKHRKQWPQRDTRQRERTASEGKRMKKKATKLMVHLLQKPPSSIYYKLNNEAQNCMLMDIHTDNYHFILSLFLNSV